jgi:crossover junction endodeoxyribonuclease RuvC
VLILGIDPGSLHTGFALLDRRGSELKALEAGRISCPRTLPLATRLGHLFHQATALVARTHPDVVAIESTFHGVNSRSLIALAQARGALLAAIAMAGLEVVQFSPAEVKAAVTGSGRADKVQVARMLKLQLVLPAETLSADASDALAIALCCAQRERFDRLKRASTP